MTNLAAALLFGGFLLMFGAVGGMDSVPPWEPNPHFWYQLAALAVGMALMAVGTLILPQGDHDE